MNAIRLLSSDVGKDVFGSHLFSWNWNAAAACSRSTAVRPRVIVVPILPDGFVIQDTIKFYIELFRTQIAKRIDGCTIGLCTAVPKFHHVERVERRHKRSVHRWERRFRKASGRGGAGPPSQAGPWLVAGHRQIRVRDVSARRHEYRIASRRVAWRCVICSN